MLPAKYQALFVTATSLCIVVFISERDDTYGQDSTGDGIVPNPAIQDWGYSQDSNPSNVLHDAVMRMSANTALPRDGEILQTV